MLQDQQEVALSAFTRAVVDFEEVAEARRRSLAETWDFVPFEAFTALRSPSSAQKACLTATDIHDWLSQESSFAVVTLDDVASSIQARTTAYGELSYGGFLRMVLPSYASDEWLQETILKRGHSSSALDNQTSQVSLAVASRLRHLFEHEIESSKQLQAQRQILQDVGVTAHMVAEYFLESTRGISHLELEALLVRGNIGHCHFRVFRPFDRSTVLSVRAPVRAVSAKATNNNQVTGAVSPSRSTRAPSVESSPRSPRSPSLLDLNSPRRPARSTSRDISAREGHTSSATVSPRSPALGRDSSSSLMSVTESARFLSQPVVRITASGEEPAKQRSSEIRSVLQLLQKQAVQDVRVEFAKGSMSTGIILEGMFDELDKTRKGFVTDSDLWSFLQEVGATTSLRSVTALVSEMQLRLAPDRILAPGRMSMRELCILTFPADSAEFELARASYSDVDFRVKFQLCQQGRDHTVPKQVRYQFQHLLDVAANSAEQLESDRRQLNLFPCEALTLLNETFNFIANGHSSFSMMDLRRAFLNQGVAASAQEVEMLWRRYQPLPFQIGVRFSDFLRQFRPRATA